MSVTNVVNIGVDKNTVANNEMYTEYSSFVPLQFAPSCRKYLLKITKENRREQTRRAGAAFFRGKCMARILTFLGPTKHQKNIKP